MSYYLAVVSPFDAPLFEAQLPSSRPAPPSSAAASTASFPSWSSFTSPTGADLGPGPGETRVGGNLGMLLGAGAGGGVPPVVQEGQAGAAPGSGFDRALAQMVAFKSLDSVEEILEGSGAGSL